MSRADSRSSDPLDRILDALAAIEPRVVEHRRRLHRIPELAFEEHETARYLARALGELGLERRTGVARTGLIVELPGAGDGPTVLVRADMDGLPIEEDPGHDPRSERAGVMHACGHDGHMAIALGLAEAVVRGAGEAPLPGRLLLLFQPAEEARGGGARVVVEEAHLDALGVDYVLGLHLWSPLARGRAIVPDGAVMASSDEVRIAFRGAGGHAALPHRAADVVLCASQFVVEAQQIVSRRVDPLAAAVVSFGSIHAGTAANVLPEEAVLRGTFRALDPGVRAQIAAEVEALARAVARRHRCEAVLERLAGYPPAINAPGVARLVRAAAAERLGEENVAAGPAVMASEDFAYLLEARPGAFLLLGMRDEQTGVVHPHHSPRFVLDESMLVAGAEILLRAAFALMRSRTGTGAPA